MIVSFQKTIKTTASTDRAPGNTTRAVRNRRSSFSPRSRQFGGSRSSRFSQEPDNEAGKSPRHQESWEHWRMPGDFGARREFKTNGRVRAKKAATSQGFGPSTGTASAAPTPSSPGSGGTGRRS